MILTHHSCQTVFTLNIILKLIIISKIVSYSDNDGNVLSFLKV